MINRLDVFEYKKVLEISYLISKSLIHNYSINSLKNIIDRSYYYKDIYEIIKEIEITESQKFDTLSKESKEKYLIYFNQLISKKLGEFVRIDKGKAESFIIKAIEVSNKL